MKTMGCVYVILIWPFRISLFCYPSASPVALCWTTFTGGIRRKKNLLRKKKRKTLNDCLSPTSVWKTLFYSRYNNNNIVCCCCCCFCWWVGLFVSAHAGKNMCVRQGDSSMDIKLRLLFFFSFLFFLSLTRFLPYGCTSAVRTIPNLSVLT